MRRYVNKTKRVLVEEDITFWFRSSYNDNDLPQILAEVSYVSSPCHEARL